MATNSGQTSGPPLEPRDRPSWNSFPALRREWPLVASVATAALFLLFGRRWLADLSNPFWLAFLVAWLFAVILLSAFAMVRHGESLALMLGEPRGTLIMTLAATGIEVMLISAFMLNRPVDGSPFARDAMFAVVMIVLNGLLGMSLLLGGMRFHEQTYNLQGANMFLAVIVPLSVIGMILPNFTASTSGPTFSTLQAIFLIVMSAGLYGVFLAVQTSSHRDHFVAPDSAGGSPTEAPSSMTQNSSGRSRITPRCCCFTCCPWSSTPNSSRSRSTMPPKPSMRRLRSAGFSWRRSFCSRSHSAQLVPRWRTISSGQ